MLVDILFFCCCIFFIIISYTTIWEGQGRRKKNSWQDQSNIVKPPQDSSIFPSHSYVIPHLFWGKKSKLFCVYTWRHGLFWSVNNSHNTIPLHHVWLVGILSKPDQLFFAPLTNFTSEERKKNEIGHSATKESLSLSLSISFFVRAKQFGSHIFWSSFLDKQLIKKKEAELEKSHSQQFYMFCRSSISFLQILHFMMAWNVVLARRNQICISNRWMTSSRKEAVRGGWGTESGNRGEVDG